jgi:hypothetical protein
MHSFMSPKVALWLGLKPTKVAKLIQIQIAQRDVTPVEEVMLGVELLYKGTKFKEDFMIVALNGFDTILG